MARFAAERGGQEREGAFERRLRSDDPRAEREDVHVVVLDALVGGVRVVAHGGTDAGQLVRRDRGPDARPTDEDAAIGLAGLDGAPEPLGEVRVVVSRVGAVATEVDELMTQTGGIEARSAGRP